jgi:Glycosyl-4,4'-diaponeurosporenoate acyltransferase
MGLRTPAVSTAEEMVSPVHGSESQALRSDAESGRRPSVVGAIMDAWFRPKRFETERLYERLGARVLKRYVPTGGDVVMRWVRTRYPNIRVIDPTSHESLRRFERGTRVAEAVHLISFVGFTVLAWRRYAVGSLTKVRFTVAIAMTLVCGLWPVVLQRYNRLRAYGAIGLFLGSGAQHRASASSEGEEGPL